MYKEKKILFQKSILVASYASYQLIHMIDWSGVIYLEQYLEINKVYFND